MSTRANIIIKDGKYKLYYYKHSDGYPEGTLPILNKFLDAVKSGDIRDNLSQACGWLTVFGHEAMKDDYEWKVGWVEPTTGLHGDVEYIYTIDLTAKTITCNHAKISMEGPVKIGEFVKI